MVYLCLSNVIYHVTFLKLTFEGRIPGARSGLATAIASRVPSTRVASLAGGHRDCGHTMGPLVTLASALQ
jgi:hypothetical protein